MEVLASERQGRRERTEMMTAFPFHLQIICQAMERAVPYPVSSIIHSPVNEWSEWEGDEWGTEREMEGYTG